MALVAERRDGGNPAPQVGIQPGDAGEVVEAVEGTVGLALGDDGVGAGGPQPIDRLRQLPFVGLVQIDTVQVVHTDELASYLAVIKRDERSKRGPGGRRTT